jgi:hypothetical protein
MEENITKLTNVTMMSQVIVRLDSNPPINTVCGRKTHVLGWTEAERTARVIKIIAKFEQW